MTYSCTHNFQIQSHIHYGGKFRNIYLQPVAKLQRIWYVIHMAMYIALNVTRAQHEPTNYTRFIHNESAFLHTPALINNLCVWIRQTFCRNPR